MMEVDKQMTMSQVGILSEPVVTRRIPLTRPDLGAEEQRAVLEVLESANLGGNGPVGAALERTIQQRFGVRRALLTTSCTHAMEMAAIVLGWGPGDEVIVPSFAFVTAATAILRQGARPVFAEIDGATWNMDPADAARRVTPRTRAILPVHYAGQGCDMLRLTALAKRHGLAIVEDAAQAVGAKYAGRWLGTIGDVGCYSFHVTKNVTCGEGGAFLTSNATLTERAEIAREKGTNRSRFLRGEVDKYTWVGPGSSYVLSDLLAAIARVQFQKFEDMQHLRRKIWWRYQTAFSDLARAGHLILPCVDSRAEPNWHIYAFRVADPARRDALISALKAQGIQAAFHFVPLHSSPYAREKLGYHVEDFPITELVSQSLVRLPIYPHLALDDQDYVIEAVHVFFQGGRPMRQARE